MARKAGGDRRPVKKRLSDEARRRRAVDLRIAGFSFPEIAKKLGWKGRTSAHKAVSEELAAAAAETREKASELLELELARCDADEKTARDLIAKNVGRARKGDKDSGSIVLGAMGRIHQIRERRARYMSLDAPTRTEITGKDGAPLLDVTLLTDEQLERLRHGTPFPGAEGGGGAGAPTAAPELEPARLGAEADPALEAPGPPPARRDAD